MTLRDMRIAANLTQEEVGRRLNINQSAVSRWESGDNGMCRKYAKPLAKMYGCTAAEIMAATVIERAADSK